MAKNPRNISGEDGQKWVRDLCNANGIHFYEAKPGQKEIDFEIWFSNKDIIYLEVSNQNGQGSTDEKIPHKVYKYWKKLRYNEVYNLMGLWDIRKKNPSIVDLCKTFKFKTHFIMREDLIKVITPMKT